MTATTAALPQLAPARPARTGVTFPRVLRSEWIKFRSVRATLWTLPITAIAMVGIAALAAWGVSNIDDRADITAVELVNGGWYLAQLAVAVLAILTITGEYTTGQIRSSITAVPRRSPILAAKSIILFAAVAAVTTVALGFAWLASLPFLNRMNMSIDLADPDALRVLLGTPLYLGTIALFSFAIGALFRHSAGALAVVLGLLLVVENVFSALPFRFFEVVSPFLPSTAGGRILMDAETLESMNEVAKGAELTAWQGYGVLVAWTVLLLAAATVLMRRRDA
jgi:ABC-2 type transport system permease protein